MYYTTKNMTYKNKNNKEEGKEEPNSQNALSKPHTCAVSLQLEPSDSIFGAPPQLMRTLVIDT